MLTGIAEEDLAGEDLMEEDLTEDGVDRIRTGEGSFLVLGLPGFHGILITRTILTIRPTARRRSRSSLRLMRSRTSNSRIIGTIVRIRKVTIHT